jgi:hypothetical protein
MWVVNATPWPLYPRKRHGTHYIGCWVGLRAGLNECEKSHPHQDSIPGPFSKSLYRLSYPGPLVNSITFAVSSYDAHIYRVQLTNTKTPDRIRTAPEPNMTAKIRISRTPRQGDRCHLKSGLDLELDLDLVLKGLFRDIQLFLSLESTSVLRNVLARGSQTSKIPHGNVVL